MPNALPNTHVDLMKLLEQLSPLVTHAAFDEKRHFVTSKFKFLRAYVPLYYYLLEVPEVKAHCSQLLGAQVWCCTGWCVGDAHPENFGVMINGQRKSIFSVNDADDSGYGFLAADLLRFLTAVAIGLSIDKLSVVIPSYLSGLQGAPHTYSKIVQKMISKAEDKPKAKALQENFDADDVEKFRVRCTEKDDAKPDDGEYTIELEDDLKRKFFRALESTYDNLQNNHYDIVEEHHPSGGSGGLSRYLAVCIPKHAPNDIENVMLIEAKQMADAGLFPNGLPQPAHDHRLAIAWEYAIPGGPHRLLKVLLPGEVNPLDVPLLLRPKLQKNSGIDLEDLTTDADIDAVLSDEAYVLGSLHRHSKYDAASMTLLPAEENSQWISVCCGVSTQTWITATTFMCSQYDRIFNLFQAHDATMDMLETSETSSFEGKSIKKRRKK